MSRTATLLHKKVTTINLNAAHKAWKVLQSHELIDPDLTLNEHLNPRRLQSTLTQATQKNVQSGIATPEVNEALKCLQAFARMLTNAAQLPKGR